VSPLSLSKQTEFLMDRYLGIGGTQPELKILCTDPSSGSVRTAFDIVNHQLHRIVSGHPVLMLGMLLLRLFPVAKLPLPFYCLAAAVFKCYLGSITHLGGSSKGCLRHREGFHTQGKGCVTTGCYTHPDKVVAGIRSPQRVGETGGLLQEPPARIIPAELPGGAVRTAYP